jgi:AraC-like DNA-binding protein
MGVMQPVDPAPAVFSTAGLPDARRVELWERHNTHALIGLDVRADGTALQATELNVQLDRVQLARVSASAHAVRRSEQMIGRAPCDAVAVYLMLRGDSWFSGHGGECAARPGDVLVCETDRPFARRFVHGLEELVVKVPRSALEEHGEGGGAPARRPPVVATFGAASDGGDPYAAALARLAMRATRTVRPVRADERTVLELVTVLTCGPQAARSAAYRAAARAYIEERLTDPGLGADRVAAAVGISERHLSRLLAADGTSVPRYILGRRLDLAHALLTAPAGPQPPERGAQTVAEVAAACGFVSDTYFSHVFRERFGRRAGDLLREARAASHFRQTAH